MGHLHVALIIEFIHTTVEDNLEPVDLRYGALFLVPKLINQLSLPLVVVEVPLIVPHVRVQLHLHLMVVN